jgi:hypothetical protein
MSDAPKSLSEQFVEVRPLTRQLVTDVLFDQPPSFAAAVDFGIDSQRHYEALYFPIRNREITPLALDAALGDGAKLTEIVRAAPSNPHKDIAFDTSRDREAIREESVEERYQKMLDEKVGPALPQVPRSIDR